MVPSLQVYSPLAAFASDGAGGDGYTDHVPDATTDEDLIAEVAIALAGGRAPELWDLVTNDDDDRYRAKQILLVRFPNSEPELILRDIQKCLDECIEYFRGSIGALGYALLEQKELCGMQAEEIIGSNANGEGNLARCLSMIDAQNRSRQSL